MVTRRGKWEYAPTSPIVRAILKRQSRITALHGSSSARAITKFMMPAMSPTMTEGGLASWKVKEGDKFAAGDVLLEIVSLGQYSSYGRRPC
jgi:hypothetical protein